MRHGIFALGILLLLCSSCREKRTMWSVQGQALGTVYEILYLGEADTALPRQADSLLRHYNALFSVFDSASWISRLNRNETDSLPEDLEKVLLRSLTLCRLTQGSFDITAAPLINAWGFGPEAAEKPDSAR
ncbi:MAG: FAD:protein FMN transferase, partial [Bacteroidales bacterium]|nr:FAD:protein FMN transferase [Bacteroidales bacterium]